MTFNCAQPMHKSNNMTFGFRLKAGFEAWIKAIQEDPAFPNQEAFMTNLDAWIASKGWKHNGGQFIPKFSEFIKKQRYLHTPFSFTSIPIEVTSTTTRGVNQNLAHLIATTIHSREQAAIANLSAACPSVAIDSSHPCYKVMTSAQRNGFIVQDSTTQPPKTTQGFDIKTSIGSTYTQKNSQPLQNTQGIKILQALLATLRNNHKEHLPTYKEKSP